MVSSRVRKKLLDLFSKGKLHGTVHTCIGQEFSAISVLNNFVHGDWAISNHRVHGHFLSITKDFDGLMSEVMGRQDGVCNGIRGSQHLYSDGFLSNGEHVFSDVGKDKLINKGSIHSSTSS